MRPITRRQVLVAGVAGVGILGAGALANELRTSDTHPGPAPPAPVASSDTAGRRREAPSLEDGVLQSAHMPSPVSWTIAHPPASTGQPVGVVYCLHGRSGTARDPFDRWRLHDEVAAAGVPLLLASPHGGDHSYWHPRRDGTDPQAMLAKEFIPMVAARVGPSLPVGLIGWSMGGYGALLFAVSGLAGPNLRAVVAASPALWTTARQSPGAFDNAADFRRHDVFTRRGRLSNLAVLLHCGTSDPFYPATKTFASGLPPGHQAVFAPGGHDDPYWRSIAGAQVDFLAAALTR